MKGIYKVHIVLATSRKSVMLTQSNNKKSPPVLKSSSLQDDKLIINFAWPNIIIIIFSGGLTCTLYSYTAEKRNNSQSSTSEIHYILPVYRCNIILL